MISQNDRQLLLLLKYDSSFVDFLSSVNSSIYEFEQVVDIITTTDCDTIFPYSTSEPEYELQTKLELDSPIETCYSNNSETHVKCNLQKPLQFKESQNVFDIVKVPKAKFKISFRKECINKKIKNMFHKYLISNLNALLSETYRYLSFSPLPKMLGINLNFSKNKAWSDMTIRELIMLEDLKQVGFDNHYKNNNLRVLSQIHSSNDINAYLDIKWKNHYKDFLNSSEFYNAIKDMKKLNDAYATKFKKLASTLLICLDN